jgi:hypothetical protein
MSEVQRIGRYFVADPDLNKRIIDNRCEVVDLITLKNVVFWDMTPCVFIINRRFGGQTQ